MSMLLVVSISLSLVLTSCWNSRELNELAIVSGIGIDKGIKKGEFRVTFQVVNPSATVTSTSGGSGLPSITVISAIDHTVFGALRKASKRVSRQLFFAHTQVVVLGESLVRDEFDGVFDIFERSHELRMNSAVLIAKDSEAGDVLKILTPVESLPSLGLIKKVHNSSSVWGENRPINVFDVIKGITGEGDFTINGVGIVGDAAEGEKKSSLEQAEVKAGALMSGLGVFKHGKLIQWMEGPEARGTQWILDKIEETIINISAGDKEQDIAVNITYAKTRVKVEILDGKPVFHIHIREEGIINETGSFIDFSRQDEIMKLQGELEKQTEAEVKLALEAAQRLKSDIFNFGNELKRINPKSWKTVEKDWDNLFAQGEAEIHIEAFIRSTGMRLQPYTSVE